MAALPLPTWAQQAKPFWLNGISGADPEPPAPPANDPPANDPPGQPPVVALSPAEISEMIGGIVAQLNSPTATDAEKVQLQKDLADAQRIIEDNANATASEAQRAQREHNRKLADAQREAEAGRDAVTYAKTLGIKNAIAKLPGENGQPKYTWQDVDTVYALLDHSTISFDFKKDEAKGLDKQLDELAKNKPFLLKSAQQQTPPGQQPGQPVPGQWQPGGAFAQPGYGAQQFVPNPGYGTPPSGGNSGGQPAQKQLSDYAGIPAYRNTLGRLAGQPSLVGVQTQPVTNLPYAPPQQ